MELANLRPIALRLVSNTQRLWNVPDACKQLNHLIQRKCIEIYFFKKNIFTLFRLYHCMSDSEGEMPQHPCECVPEESVCSKRYANSSLVDWTIHFSGKGLKIETIFSCNSFNCFFFCSFSLGGSVYFYYRWYFLVYVSIQRVMVPIKLAFHVASVVANISHKCDKPKTEKWNTFHSVQLIQ